MNHFDIPLNVGLIDSLTLFVELEKIKVIDYKLITPFQVYYEDTAEIIEDLNPPKPIYIDSNAIRFRFSKVFWTHPKTNETKEMVCITITAKMLRERYFEGINKDNIKDICEYINSHNIISIDLETLLNANVNDVDICMNYRLEFKAYQSALKMLYDMVKPSKKHAVELYPRNENQRINENIGLSYSRRETAKIGTPFIKFYNKAYELVNNSVDFYNLYIFPQLRYGLTLKNLIRKEITIRNAQHKASLLKKRLVTSTDKLQTLNDFLQLKQKELDLIINVQLKTYYEKKQFSVSSELTSIEKVLSYYMFELVERGMDKVMLQYPLKMIDCKVNRSRTKKKLEQIMDLTFNENYMEEKLNENSIANQFIKMQNIW
ncbi:hypothetical protein [Flavobacterium sp.]|uniref:hypothetical protein n=1 Tax=Flavobacterium sp. TaxID=239 RepID=UPI0022BC22D8|nr:hypothetical protein [Flavobacterium sp.]MCZ8168765.1 hypothetical protein [Flavobacterium sp.]